MNAHLADDTLLAAADGELSGERMAEARTHLAGCAACRQRLSEFEEAMTRFLQLRESLAHDLPPVDAARARLAVRLTGESGGPARPARGLMHIAAFAAIAALAAIVFSLPAARPHGALPDARLTPGDVRPVSIEDVCAPGADSESTEVPVELAHAVFAAYGIREPEPRSYEMDFLITPALGGASSVRNFWPQPYRNTPWNAHIKDALEDRLQRMVCSGEIELAEAQREIARDWVAAYKKHFRTPSPLREHAAFLKDRPWE